jgi:oligopeptide/dipeptide ABC transporter ATP-binding protein
LLDIRRLAVRYRVPGHLLGGGGWVHAVEDVSLSVDSGQTVGLVGESGCGKSTVLRSVLRLVPVHSGEIRFDGVDVLSACGAVLARLRRAAQLVFQDPAGALNPRMSVAVALTEALRRDPGLDAPARRDRVAELLATVGLGPEHADRFPHELSGGQRQRVVIARALCLNPRLLLADEPVSALDVSVQAQIIALLKDLQRRFDLGCLFVAHDLAVVANVSDRVLVMYLGRIVEDASAADLVNRALHPYTQALMAAIPSIVPGGHREPLLRGELPSAMVLPPGCPFHPRCPVAEARCREEIPELRPVEGGASAHRVACHLVVP